MIITGCRKCGGHKPVNSIADRVCFECIETEARIKKLEEENQSLEKQRTFILKWIGDHIHDFAINGEGFMKRLKKALEDKDE